MFKRAIRSLFRSCETSHPRCPGIKYFVEGLKLVELPYFECLEPRLNDFELFGRFDIFEVIQDIFS